MIFSLTLISCTLIVGWLFGQTDIPVGIKDLLLVVIGALAGMTKPGASEIPHDSTVTTDSTTTVVTPKEGE